MKSTRIQRNHQVSRLSTNRLRLDARLFTTGSNNVLWPPLMTIPIPFPFKVRADVHSQYAAFVSGNLTMKLAVLLTPSTDYIPSIANSRSCKLARSCIMVLLRRQSRHNDSDQQFRLRNLTRHS